MSNNSEYQPGQEQSSFTSPFQEELNAQRAEAEARDDSSSIDIRAHDEDSAEVLESKLRALHEIEDEVRISIDDMKNPDTKRDVLFEAMRRYAKQLHMDVNEATSLSILVDMSSVINDYRNDIHVLLEKKHKEQQA